MFKESNLIPLRKTDPSKNEIFKLEKNLEEIYEFSKEVAEYLKSEDIHNLVLMDRKARNFYVGVKEYWKAKFPDLKEPNYYFINPQGFGAKEEADLKEEFAQAYKNLDADKDQPILIFDACIHSGNSLYPVKKFFDQSGFSDVRIASIKSRYQEPDALVKPDLLVGQDYLEHGPARGCAPFGDGTLVEKNSQHVYTEPTQDPESRRKALKSKEEIKQAIKDYLEKE